MNIIVTGGTSGIGLETVKALAGHNACIILPVRNLNKGEQVKQQISLMSGNPCIYLIECDLSSFESIRSFAREYKKRFDRLDVLINNAGTWETERKETKGGVEMNFGVNHLAPFLMTNLLLDELRASSQGRIINVSSEAHRHSRINFDDLEGKKKFSSFRAYSQSKLANILFTRFLSNKLRDEKISVNCLHPGVVATNLFDKMNPFLRSVFGLFMITPRKGAETIIYLASSTEFNGSTGEYFVRKKIKKPSVAALDNESARKLWEVSREYTGI